MLLLQNTLLLQGIIKINILFLTKWEWCEICFLSHMQVITTTVHITIEATVLKRSSFGSKTQPQISRRMWL